MLKVPHILLSAGASARMGKPKALLSWGKSSLIQSRIQTLANSQQPIITVLGAHWKDIQKEITKSPCHVCLNPNWPEGMGSSISKGVSYAVGLFPEADGILISLVDQPLIPPSHFLEMMQAFQEDTSKIIVSQSETGWSGVPVLFGKMYFSELQSLKGTNSGKDIIVHHSKQLLAIDGKEYLKDMDTPEEYAKLLSGAEYN